MTGLKRTCKCGEINAEHLGKEVTVMGWVKKQRDHGGVIFIDLRDISGIVQIVFPQDNAELLAKADKARSEHVIAVRGTVRERDEVNINPNIATGKYEIIATELRILSSAETLPFTPENASETNEIVRMKYRFLDLRSERMQRNLSIRHKVTNIARNYFADNGFLDIETPMLIKSTPEGARDYLVPSRVHHGSFYALPQSPQLFKQILMVSGMDRYMQIAKCFRDEDLRADRQPEFTQIDLEMSFVDCDDVMTINEGFIKRAFKEILDIDIKTPIARMTYKDAMEMYGSDKPDTRFEMTLKNISSVLENTEFKVFADVIKKGGSVRAINAKGMREKMSRREIDALTEYVKLFNVKGLAWIVLDNGELKSPITKFLTQEEIDNLLKAMDAKDGDIIFIIADKDEIALRGLGELRLEIARKYDLIDKSLFNFLWVTEFPLLEYDEESNRYVAIHHPFTSPMDEDLHLLETDPSKARAKAYDIVLNGTELGGGSIRIHNSEIQSKMFELLGFAKEEAEERFGFLLEAFKYGVPPHGGLAYGLDRLVMLMVGEESIRDVMAFPKNKDAVCPLTMAPGLVEPKQLRELGIELRKDEK